MNALDASGDPVTISAEYLGLFSQDQNFNVFEQTGQKGQGFYYRIPANIKLTISMNDESLGTEILQINQLGSSTIIPVTDNIDIQFYPESGLIKKIILE